VPVNLWPVTMPRLRYGLDGPFLAVIAVLAGWGLVMLASASTAIGERMAGSSMYYFDRQLLFMALGICGGVVVFMVPMTLWRRLGFPLLALALLLLVIVLVPGIGSRVNSASRWIHLGPLNVQASEPARLALAIYIAGYVARRQLRLQQHIGGLLVAFVPLGAAAVLLLLEPDFGATALLLTVSVVMLFLGGARLRDVLGFGLLLSVAMAALAVAAPYRVRRFLSFLDPWAHAQDAGYQLAQSLIAVGRGHVFGVGLGNSVQKLLYLPEMQTDFIFAIFAEEFGLIGIVALITLFALLVWRVFVIGRVAERRNAVFEACLTYGLGTWLGLQTLINMAVNMGLLPTKGLTLPLFSYGGSSLITLCAMVALILRVDFENRAANGGAGVARALPPTLARRLPWASARPVRNAPELR
jgi:cell division protein FtsW